MIAGLKKSLERYATESFLNRDRQLDEYFMAEHELLRLMLESQEFSDIALKIYRAGQTGGGKKRRLEQSCKPADKKRKLQNGRVVRVHPVCPCPLGNWTGSDTRLAPPALQGRNYASAPPRKKQKTERGHIVTF